MKNKQNINKEDLWGKILVDERMPKKSKQISFVKKYWHGLFLFSILLLVGGYFLVCQNDETKNYSQNKISQLEVQSRQKSLPNLTQLDDLVSASENNQEGKVKDGKTKSGEINIEKNSLQIHSEQSENKSTSNEGKQKAKSEISTINKKTKSTSENTTIPIKVEDQTNNQSKINKSLSEALEYKKENQLIFENKGLQNQIQPEGAPNTDKEIKLATANNAKKRDYSTLSTKNDVQRPLEVNQESDSKDLQWGSINGLGARQLTKIIALPTSIPMILTDSKYEFDLQHNKNIEIEANQKSKLSAYLTMGYGPGSRISEDENGVSLGAGSPYSSRLKSYQIELGIGRKFGSWGIRLGIGSDILEGNSKSMKVDTSYSLIDETGSFQRVENTTNSLLYQRFGNIYLASGIDYEFTSGAWAVQPRLGLKYHLSNISNGTTIESNTFEKREIIGTEPRNKFNMSIGIEVHRQLTDRFYLTFGSKYEGKVKYQLSDELSQSVSSFYFSIGGGFRL